MQEPQEFFSMNGVDWVKDLMTQLQDLDRLWDPTNLKASRAAFEAVMPEAEKLEGSDRSFLIEVQSLIARLEAFEGNFPQARSSLKKSEQLLTEQKATYRVSARIRWLLEAGRVHVLEKTPAQGRVLFAEAWTLAMSSREDAFAVETAQLIAATEPQKAQREWIQRGIEIAEKSPQPKAKRWLGSLYATVGWKLYDLRQYENALETFQKSLTCFKAHHGTARETFVAQWSIGKVLRILGKTEEALAIQKVLLAELGIGGVRDGRLYEEIAECLQTLKRAPEAQLYFELAYRELSKDDWFNDNRPVKLKRMKELGKVK